MLIRIVDANVLDPFAALQAATVQRDEQAEAVVAAIIADVRDRGDAALLDNAQKFDSPNVIELEVPTADITDASLEPRFESAISTAAAQINMFHTAQMLVLTSGLARIDARGPIEQVWPGGVPPKWSWDTGRAGADFEPYLQAFASGTRGQRILPLDRVGVYVPGGNANYPSSVLMNAIPARVAGVREVVVCSPAGDSGRHTDAVCFALKEANVDRAFRIGGAAAVAAMAFGTETVPRVDKIVGPGNRWVNEAKRQVWGKVGLDGYAGPSEVCVVVDESANDRFAAADLLTQVEHAPDNVAYLIATTLEKLEAVLAEVERQLTGAPREATMRAALANNSIAIVALDLFEAVELVNVIAPEHLTLSVEDPHRWLEKVQNAGCVLLGDWTPESAGDYCIGPSHTLPTSGAARWQSPVNVLEFLKVQSVSNLSKEALEFWAPIIEAFGEMEGFPAHARGASIRFE